MKDKHPYSNTGALNTCIVDWCEFTLFRMSVDEVKAWLQMVDCDWEVMRGWNGYRGRIRAQGVSIMFDGNDNMGIHISATGEGCRWLELGVAKKWVEFWAAIRSMGGGFSRVDVAFDDVSGGCAVGLLDMEEIDHLQKTRAFRSSWKEGELREHRDFTKDGRDGKTIYFGSTKSLIFVRFYDKAVEQDVENVWWTRCEVVLRDRYADKVVDNAINGGQTAAFVAGVLSSHLTFIVPNPNDKNKSRWPTVWWWGQFLNGVEQVDIEGARMSEMDTVERKKEWLMRSVAPTFATVMCGYGDDLLTAGEFVKMLRMEGETRMKKNHQRMVAEKIERERVKARDRLIQQEHWANFMEGRTLSNN